MTFKVVQGNVKEGIPISKAIIAGDYIFVSGEVAFDDTGEIVITAINITSVSNSSGTITITVIPSSNDIVPVRNQILEIDSTNTIPPSYWPPMESIESDSNLVKK